MNHIIKSLSASAAALMLMALSFAACTASTDPQPVKAGKDDCTACGMTIMKPQFACEIVTNKGKCFKFDDASCLFHYMHKHGMSDSIAANIYIADYEHPDSLIDIKTAGLVLSETVQTPMGGGVIAFSNHQHAEKFALDNKSILLDSWTRLKVSH